MEQQCLPLSLGYMCPMLGLGTYKLNEESSVIKTIKFAVQSGYRHIDTAYVYNNESSIGLALDQLFQEKVVSREEMFITTKLFGTHSHREQVPQLLRKQLKLLRLEYVDLYLIHSPLSLQYHEKPEFPKDEKGNLIFDTDVTLEETWLGMEDCVRFGLARLIGVSNFNETQLERIIQNSSIKPAMLQIEGHPYFQNQTLIDYCHSNNVAVTCFYPLGSRGKTNVLSDKKLIAIGSKYGKTAAQVILRWQIQRGVVAIPKSETLSHIKENFNIWDFELSNQDMAEIAVLDTNKRAFTADFPGARLHPDFPFQKSVISLKTNQS